GDGVRPAEHLRQLVGPAGIPDDPVDRALDLGAAAAELGELGRARLHHLREPVEHLAAVVRGRARPAGLRLSRGPHGVARVLARAARDVLPLRLVRAPRLAARERAADEELVRLLDRKPVTRSGAGRAGASAPCRLRRAYAGHPPHASESSKARYGSSPWRPPSRPKPDSL